MAAQLLYSHFAAVSIRVFVPKFVLRIISFHIVDNANKWYFLLFDSLRHRVILIQLRVVHVRAHIIAHALLHLLLSLQTFLGFLGRRWHQMIWNGPAEKFAKGLQTKGLLDGALFWISHFVQNLARTLIELLGGEESFGLILTLCIQNVGLFLIWILILVHIITSTLLISLVYCGFWRELLLLLTQVHAFNVRAALFWLDPQNRQACRNENHFSLHVDQKLYSVCQILISFFQCTLFRHRFWVFQKEIGFFWRQIF